MPDRLPIYDIESELINSLARHSRLILSSPTGSGKSTQVPQMLLAHGLLDRGQTVILQPRRLAARLLAKRVASERSCQLGGEVGYQIRFENVTSPRTVIRYVTEGVLLRQMLEDPTLRGMSVLIFDEFHERHLYGDITLARALDILERSRPDLKILVMSATLDAAALEAYLHPCTVLQSAGRVFPVGIEYSGTPSYADKRPVWEQAAAAFSDYVQSGQEGDVLIFMPGSFEIFQTIQAVRNTDESRGFILLPLHGELPPEEQDAAVARYQQRKVVVTTNVAETSLTIDGIRCVIDSGLARIPRYDPYRSINTLLVDKISQASADQRAGRAGRTAPGVCMRLWSRDEHSHRPAQEVPEVKRLDLAEVVLTLKAAGVDDLSKFRWLERPDSRSLEHAEELLTDLGALKHASSTNPSGSPDSQESSVPAPAVITSLGRKMLAFPLHPRYSRMLLAAHDYGCVSQACLVAALTQGRDLLLRGVDRQTENAREDLLGEKADSDFWILMRAWSYASRNQFRLDACRRVGLHSVTARQVAPLYQQFLDIAEREGLALSKGEPAPEALQKCILLGFSDRVAHRLDSGTLRCELVHGRTGVLARQSVVQHSPLLVVAEIREVEGKDKSVTTILSLATALDQKWLFELFPEDIAKHVRCYFDSGAKRVYADEQLQFRGLTIGARKLEPPPLDDAARLLTTEVLAGRLVLKEWDHSIEQWIARLNLLAGNCPELALPALTPPDREHIIAQLCHGAFTYKDIKEKPVRNAVKNWLNSAQQDLVDKHAPERLSLSNGRTPKVTYEPGSAPYISVRIQELFGVTSTPRIGMGRIPVVVHILAPSMRPVQITQDLSGFWRDHYPRIKQELQRKYPKHEWK